MPAQVTIQDAYNEACQALGDSIVQQRLMAKAASAQIEALQAKVDDLVHLADKAPDVAP